MFTLDEIIKLKNEGFSADEIVELSNISTKAIENNESKVVEESKVEEPEKTDEPKNESLDDKNENLKSFNEKIDALLNSIKENNIKSTFIETSKQLTGEEILANVINPITKERLS